MKDPETWVVLAVGFVFGFLTFVFATMAWGSQLHWQQRDPPPVDSWEVWTNIGATPTLRATILPTRATQETVTPVIPPWFPTPGPGTPTPALQQWSQEVPEVRGGEIIALRAAGLGGTSPYSNVQMLNTETTTPTSTATASATNTVTGTPTAQPTATWTQTKSPTVVVATPTTAVGHPSAPHLM